MGVDLTLLPITYEGHDVLVSDTLLQFDSNSLIFEFYDIPLYPLEKKFISHVAHLPEELHESLEGTTYGFHYFGVTTADAYGGALKYALAGDIQVMLKELPPEVLDDASHFERPALAYLMALTPSYKIVFYWW